MKTKQGKGKLGDIAARCGVSTRVVAAVLSPHGAGTVGFSDATRRKVEAAARQTGYQGNRTARWLGRGRHGSLGIVASSSYLIPDPMMNGLLLAARQCRLFLVFDRALANESSMFLSEHCVDGLIVFDDLRQAGRRQIAAMNLPTLWVNTNQRKGPNVVTYDEGGAARLAVEHLRERGWHRPAVLHFAGTTHYSAAERLAGARAAAPDLAVFAPPTGSSITDEAVVARVAEIEALLRVQPALDGAVAFSPWLVPPLYEALRRLGRQPGRDFGVVTFGRFGPGRTVFPQVTALAFDEEALGRRIVGLLEDSIEGRAPATWPVTVRYELVERGSTNGGKT